MSDLLGAPPAPPEQWWTAALERATADVGADPALDALVPDLWVEDSPRPDELDPAGSVDDAAEAPSEPDDLVADADVGEEPPDLAPPPAVDDPDEDSWDRW